MVQSIGRRLASRWPVWRDRLIQLPRLTKRALLVTFDLGALMAALWLAQSLRLGTFYVPPTRTLWLVMLAAPLIGVLTFAWFGLYRLVTRYIGPHGTGRVLACLALSVLLWALLVQVAGVSQTGIPRTVPFIYLVFAAAIVLSSRYAAAWALQGLRLDQPKAERKAILIYGAGPAGVQLLEALRRAGDTRPAGFIDDTATLWGQYVGGVKVYRPEKIQRLIEREGVKEVVLAMPEAQRRERRAVLRLLERFPVIVKSVPAIEDFASGRVRLADLKPVGVDELLGRDPVPPDRALLAQGILGKSVMVTGAGGSIGSELVRQIIEQQPSRLVLYEVAEPALYDIEMEVRERLAKAGGKGWPAPEVLGVLGSVLDERLLAKTLTENAVHTVYHAAAYKHVPIVEANPVAGLTNNTIGTGIAAVAARRAGVERFVLVSTDKAVRPTNVMGASKRLAELILQAHADDPACETIFTMVRFGNVLDSSGSVVRRFRHQIEAGGPVTVTHPEVIRYFMSIPEAAELVLQAGAMAEGGEVFVLEMGDPVRIDDLARSMIRLMGLEVRDEQNPAGDIAIAYTGLRPGEKLYEELLIGEATSPTAHPRIMRHAEPHLTAAELDTELQVLRQAMAEGNSEKISAVLVRTVEGYRPDRAEPVMARAAIVAPSTRTIH